MKWYTFFVFVLVLIISCGGNYTRKKINSELVGTWCSVYAEDAWMKFDVDGSYIMAFNVVEYNGEWYNCQSPLSKFSGLSREA